MKAFLNQATQPGVQRRSIRVALLVGTILILINYFDRFLSGSITRADVLKIALTYCVPYMVATWASISSIDDMDPSG